MDSDVFFEKGQEWISRHWNLIFLLAGIVLLLGAVLNRNWLCDPKGAPYSQLFGRNARRIIFGSAGAVLIVVGIAMLI